MLVIRHHQLGDRFTEASLRFNLNAVFLARDQPELALEELSRVSWMPPEGGYHVQHWYAEQARAEHALYTGNVDVGLVRLRSALSFSRARSSRGYASTVATLIGCSYACCSLRGDTWQRSSVS